MDEHTQFRTAVRTVLTILLEEDCDPADRVQHATEILPGLPVPMPSNDQTDQIISEPDTPLYIAGADGLPTRTPYIPVPEEGPLTEEEVAIMLREQRQRCTASRI